MHVNDHWLIVRLRYFSQNHQTILTHSWRVRCHTQSQVCVLVLWSHCIRFSRSIAVYITVPSKNVLPWTDFFSSDSSCFRVMLRAVASFATISASRSWMWYGTLDSNCKFYNHDIVHTPVTPALSEFWTSSQFAVWLFLFHLPSVLPFPVKVMQ